MKTAILLVLAITGGADPQSRLGPVEISLPPCFELCVSIAVISLNQERINV